MPLGGLLGAVRPVPQLPELPPRLGVGYGLHGSLKGLPGLQGHGPRLVLQDLLGHFEDGLVSLHAFPFLSAYRRPRGVGAVGEQPTYARTEGTYIGLSAYPGGIRPGPSTRPYPAKPDPGPHFVPSVLV